MRLGLLILAVLNLFVACFVANAEDRDRCFPNYIKFDVCAEAEKIQTLMAESLPQQVNENMTMQHVVAVGPRLGLVVIWQFSDEDMSRGLRTANMSKAELELKMYKQTVAHVCGQKQMAAFVDLGGEFQYFYRTLDGTPYSSPLVQNCE